MKGNPRKVAKDMQRKGAKCSYGMLKTLCVFALYFTLRFCVDCI
jgi:hypothetical protein